MKRVEFEPIDRGIAIGGVEVAVALRPWKLNRSIKASTSYEDTSIIIGKC